MSALLQASPGRESCGCRVNARGPVLRALKGKRSQVICSEGGEYQDRCSDWMVKGALHPEIAVRTGQIWAIIPVIPPYPWLGGHGSIEAFQSGDGWARQRKYPWLGGHGSIEA